MLPFPPHIRTIESQIHNGQAETGFAQLMALADQGDQDAIFLLGIAAERGYQGEPDEAKAAQWYTKGAELGNTSCMLSLGCQHATGRGVARDSERCLYWLQRGADEGDPRAWYWMGICFEDGQWAGIGFPRDFDRAADYYLKGAARGDANAQFALSRLHHNGTGVLRDDLKALEYVRLAAAQEHSLAQETLASLYETGMAGLAQDKKQAEALYRRSARNGSYHAGNALCRFTRVLNLQNVIVSPFIVSKLSGDQINDLLRAYQYGNWGDVSPQHWDENDRALVDIAPIVAHYQLGPLPVIIFSDAEGDNTCVQHRDEDPPRFDWTGHFFAIAKGMRRALKFARFVNGLGA